MEGSQQDMADRLSEAHGQGQEQALADVARWLGCGPTVGEVEARCKALMVMESRLRRALAGLGCP